MLLDFTTPKGIILPRIRRALSYFVDWHSLLFGTMDIPPFERYLLIHLLPDKDSFPILSGHFHAFHKRSLRCYTFGTPSTRGHAYSIPVWVYAGLCYLPRVIPVRTFPGLAILCRGFSATLPNPGRVGTDKHRFSLSSQVALFRIRIAYRVTVHHAMWSSTVCLAFSTLYHRIATLSRTFFATVGSDASSLQFRKIERVTVQDALSPSPFSPS